MAVGSADEIDAIGTKRYESQSGGEREIQRTMLELLNQMDGFDSMGDVKVHILTSYVFWFTFALLMSGDEGHALESKLDDICCMPCHSIGTYITVHFALFSMMCMVCTGHHGHKQNRLTGSSFDQTW